MKFINDIKVLWQDKYAQALIALFSLIFGLVKSLSEFVYEKNEIKIDTAKSMGYALICYLLLNFFYYLITYNYNAKSAEIISPRKFRWSFFTIFIVSYGICWLTYWPGTVYIDNWWISLSESDFYIAKQHPITYCALIFLFTKTGFWLGGFNYSIALYTGLQILIMSLFMSSLFLFIFQRKIPKIVKIILILSCVLLPVYALFTISSTKDVYWSLSLAGFTISLYRLYTAPVQQQRRSFWILFNLYLLGIILFRNNGIYVILPILICLLWLLPEKRKQFLVSIGIILLSMFLTFIWMKSLNIQPMFQEKVSIPIQQTAAVVKKEGNITPAQSEFISQIIPIETIKNWYDPYNVDTLKWECEEFNSNFLNRHSIEFLKIWKDIVLKNFKISSLAYLQAVYWYWAPSEKEKLNLILERLPNEKETFLIAWILDNGYTKHEMIPSDIRPYLTKYYEQAYGFWHEGSLFWIVLGCALLYFLKQRNLKCLIIYLPILLLWLTLMIAAPIHSFRYALSYIYTLPFFIALLFTEKETKF